MWLPESTIEQHVNDVLPTLTPLDVGPLGFLLLFPLRRSGLTRPFFRMPEPDGHPFVWLFDVLTASRARADAAELRRGHAGAQPALVRRRARAGWHAVSDQRDRVRSGRIGGGITVRCGPQFRKRKQRFDPDNILAPGLGIFA